MPTTTFGNGEGYTGKVYGLLNPGQACPDNDLYEAKIQINLNRQALLVRDGCQNLASPQAVDVIYPAGGDLQLIFNGQVFTVILPGESCLPIVARSSTGGIGVNVRDFGAVGDGLADDTAAIQAALDASNGDRVVFPPGTYLHSDILRVTVPGTILWGYQGTEPTPWSQGAVLFASSPQLQSISLQADNTGIYGLTLNGLVTRQGNEINDHRIVAGAVANIQIVDNQILTAQGAGIFLSGTREFTIARNRISHTLFDRIRVVAAANGSKSSNGKIVQNIIDDPESMQTFTGRNGIYIESLDTESHTNIIIKGNTIRNIGFGNGIHLTGVSDATVEGNVIANICTESAVKINNETIRNPDTSNTNILVRGNQISNINVPGCNPTEKTDHAAIVTYQIINGRGRNILFTDNTISDSNTAALGVGRFNYIQQCDIAVTNNYTFNTTAHFDFSRTSRDNCQLTCANNSFGTIGNVETIDFCSGTQMPQVTGSSYSCE